MPTPSDHPISSESAVAPEVAAPPRFGVLGPVSAWDEDGAVIALRGARNRAVLARLIAARGRVVPAERLIADLWDDPPENAGGALQTFVGELRRALEPGRAPRTPATVIVSEGSGYALRAPAAAVDAWRFENLLAAAAPLAPRPALDRLETALDLWRGQAYDGLRELAWADLEGRGLDALRLDAIEAAARARIELGEAAASVADLEAHAAANPWREEAWRLLALALYRAGRQAEALDALRRAGAALREELGLDPGPELTRLESAILHQADPLAPRPSATDVWERATTAHQREVPAAAPSRLLSTVELLRSLAVSGPGGLESARAQRAELVAAAERHGDPVLTARVIGSFDVPSIWTRVDDPEQSERIVAAARRTLARLDPGADSPRVRLLATIALEARGSTDRRAREAAGGAERIARDLGDPTALAFALNGVWMQSFGTAGDGRRRDAIGAEIVALATRHELENFAILGHLIQMQARAGLGDVAGADAAAGAAEALAERHDRSLVAVFVGWYRALRTVLTGAPAATVTSAYGDALALLPGCNMPGFAAGLPALTGLCLHLTQGSTVPADPDWGPYARIAAPVLAVAEGRDAEARRGLRDLPDPPPGLMAELSWAFLARAAAALDDAPLAERARRALDGVDSEWVGAGSGLLALAPS